MTKKGKILSLILLALTLICTFAISFPLMVSAEEPVTEIEETVTPEEPGEEVTDPEPEKETELVSTNPYDLITFQLTDSEGVVLFESNDLAQYATNGGTELFYDKMSVSIPVNFVSNDYVIFRFKIDFDKCEGIDNIETFKKFNLQMSNFFIYKQGATTPTEIRFSSVNSLSDVYDKAKENVSFKVSPTYFTYERTAKEGAIEDQKGEIVFYQKDLLFNSGDKGAITFDLVSYVEIEKREIKEEKPGTSQKVEDWFNNAGDKVSNWLSENTGVAVGGTTGLIVLIAGAIILVKILKKRR